MQLPSVFDPYSRRARLFPALVAGGSLVVAAFVLVPLQNMGLPQLGAGLFSGVLVYALADIARRRGKRLEDGLYQEWGANHPLRCCATVISVWIPRRRRGT
jgi:hypothetical protein